jgi:hypothetical protein
MIPRKSKRKRDCEIIEDFIYFFVRYLILTIKSTKLKEKKIQKEKEI